MRTLLLLTFAALTAFAGKAADLIPSYYTNANWRYVQRPPTVAELRTRVVHATFDSAAVPTLASVNSAIAACSSNRIVVLTNSDGGSFTFAGRLRNGKDGVYVVGNGQNNTKIVIKNTGSTEDSMFALSTGNHDQLLTTSTAYDVWTNDIASVSIGSTNLSLKTAPTEWAVGDIVQFDYLEGDGTVESDGNSGACTWCSRASGDRPNNIQVQVLAIANNTNVTFWPPLDLNLNIAQTPQGIEHKGIVRNAGFANLILTNVASSRDIVLAEGTWDCGIVDSRLYICDTRGVWVFGGGQLGIVGTDIRFGEGADWGSGYTSSHGYGISFSLQHNRPLVENCFFEKLSFAIAMEGGGSGGVFAYNVFTNVMTDAVDAAKEFFGNHGAHPRGILWEGNFGAARLLHDHYWGSSERIATFRNRHFMVYTQDGTPVTQYAILYEVWTNNIFHLAVGNRFGEAGLENQFDVLNGGSVNSGTTNKAIRRVGNQNANHTTWSQYHNRAVTSLVYSINWQSATNGGTNAVGLYVNSDIADTNPPLSLYLTTTRPSWMGNRRYPAVDPFATTNPPITDWNAGIRGLFGTNETAGEAGPGPDPSTLATIAPGARRPGRRL